MEISTVALDQENQMTVYVEYDIYGNKIQMKDNDAGLFNYDYNPFGQIIFEQNPNGTKNFIYDLHGRIKKEINSTEGEIEYFYVPNSPNNNGIGLIERIEGPNQGDTVTFQYDIFGNITQKTKTIDNSGTPESFTHNFTYDNLGRLKTKTLPSGIIMEYEYDKNNLVRITRTDNNLKQLLWTLLETDEYGSITKYQQGGSVINPNQRSILNEITFDEYRFPNKVRASNDNGVSWLIQNWEYDYNPYNGNMNRRMYFSGGLSQFEIFEYDDLDRLVRITDGLTPPNEKLAMSYLKDGSIQSKSDVGNYFYNSNGNNTTPEFPYHGVKKIESTNGYEMKGHTITTTSFNSVKTLTAQCDYFTEFYYGSDYQRDLMKVYYKGGGSAPGTLSYSKYYVEDFEKTVFANGEIKTVSYLSSPSGIIATVVKEYVGQVSTGTDFYFITADILGNVERLSNQFCLPITGAKFSYDAWGKLRDPDDWDQPLPQHNRNYFEILGRGYTGHEHLFEFSLINMNGRVYDQNIGQFIQPDNNIVFPDQPQSYNRFSYVLNNPLKYTDPTGEELFSLIAFTVGKAAWAAYNAYHLNGGEAAMWRSIGYSALSFGFNSIGLADKFSSVLGSRIAGNAAGTISSSFLMHKIMGDKYTLNRAFLDAASGALQGYFQQKQIDNKLKVRRKEDLSSVDGKENSKVEKYRQNAIDYNNSAQSDLDTKIVENSYSNDFGLSEGDLSVSHVTTKVFNEGYGLTDNNELIGINPGRPNDFGMIFRGKIFFAHGRSAIAISPHIVQSGDNLLLRATLGHELIHSYHHSVGLNSEAYSEVIAYTWEHDLYIHHGRIQDAMNRISVGTKIGYFSKVKYNWPTNYNVDNVGAFLIW